MDQTPDLARLSRLAKILERVCSGKLSVDPSNWKLYLESIYSNPEPVMCINRLLTNNRVGLAALKSSLYFDASPDFLNGPATHLCRYLSDSRLAEIHGGEYLGHIVGQMINPPIFWDAFVNAFKARRLTTDGEESFAWLLLQATTAPIKDLQDRTAFTDIARDEALIGQLLNSRSNGARTHIYKLRHLLSEPDIGSSKDAPGGRHDNDYVDFRAIAIVPTADELESTERPFLRTTSYLKDPDNSSTRTASHLDNQFRLLREDMMSDIREEIHIASGMKKGRHYGLVLEVSFVGILSPDGQRRKICVNLESKDDLRPLKKLKNVKEREQYLKDHKNVLKHQCLACLLVDNRIVSFPVVHRDESLLAKERPVITVLIEARDAVARSLMALKSGKLIKLVQIDSSVFTYEPVLQALQALRPSDLYLEHEILHWSLGDPLAPSPSLSHTSALVDKFKTNRAPDLGHEFSLKKRLALDDCQAASFLSGLTQAVSIIQGPPGTGKSFIGALLAKALYDLTKSVILVVCYTNHALDQFLEDIMDNGVSPSHMTRLGGKATQRTEQLNVYRAARASYPVTRADWSLLKEREAFADGLKNKLMQALPRGYATSMPSTKQILDLLEFEEPRLSQAFRMPKSHDGMQLIGKKGKALGPDYLFQQWKNGKDAGILRNHALVRAFPDVWEMSPVGRLELVERWSRSVLQEEAEAIAQLMVKHNAAQDERESIRSQGTAKVLQSKRIIACTTTAAAKYRKDIKAAAPSILLVEEAGEILESHILTAMGSSVKQLILIGDHKQLRPKCASYHLSVEKGDGFDINRSLFERLVLSNYPHHTLSLQHRMRPEISKFVRKLTYPELQDAPSTQNRADVKGLQRNVVFINHTRSEDGDGEEEDIKDRTRTNIYEVKMVMKIVKYLGQQGYGTDKLVILTPYLGQLHLLRRSISDSHDPVLNDLDSFDLVKAGLIPEATAKLAKKPIRLATIDNYQGEESDIVIASLTRGNSHHDIGFMSAPERLNVLLSRARDGLIMIGNGETFKNPKRGGAIWKSFFEIMENERVIFDGLPVICQRHPAATACLKTPEDFGSFTPEGGCTERCDAALSCGLHKCPSKCHQIYDHSKMSCEHPIESTCSNGHKKWTACGKNKSSNCVQCGREQKRAKDAARREADRQAKRDADQTAHDAQIAALDTQIAAEQEKQRDRRLASERDRALAQKRQDLQDAHARTNMKSTPMAPTAPADPSNSAPSNSSAPSGVASLAATAQSLLSQLTSGFVSNPVQTAASPSPPPVSPAEAEWQRQKRVEGAQNAHIDSMISMIGLEKVKQQVLDLKAEVEVSLRQGVSMNKNLNVALLGNPGTGKTTVARLYAKLLASINVLPGTEFVETTGASLANEGIPGVHKILDKILKAGGGAVFVDEAYQLTEAHNPGGRAVLDLLLTQMLDNVGKIVFLFAGYRKNMEAFFQANPGLPSRIPYSFQFEDYTDEELTSIFGRNIEQKFGKGKMSIEGGLRGLYVRIAVRRVGMRRGRDGFGNAREIANLIDQVTQRQAKRLNDERRDGRKPNDFLMVAADIIGPNPAEAAKTSKAWKELQSMIGLVEVKASLQSQIDMIQTNYDRELKELKPLQMSLNRVFLGNPGTGKTTVAKLYGCVLADMGLLSNGEVIIKNPSDFVGDVVGGSEANTKGILANSRGKVLVIDEAYGLYEAKGNSTGFRTAVIDTIVAEVQSTAGEDRCVLLLGYKDQMEEMFQNVNPGLSRRFAIEDAFNFTDFSTDELTQILNMKLKGQDLDATPQAKAVALDVLQRKRVRPNFGNAGEIDNMLGTAKSNYQSRQSRLPASSRAHDVTFEPQDFDPHYARSNQAASNLTELFKDMVGADTIIQKLRNLQETAERMKKRGIDYRSETPTTFVFSGPPGTGKTTVARKIGKVYYDMGFLASDEVIDCSASDLVGQYVGHTGPLVREKFDKALGKCLFIDEAYRLSEGHFAKEAIDEMVDCLTKEKYRGRLVVILAGYEEDIHKLLSVNRGLASRFTEEIPFHNMTTNQCLDLLQRLLKKNDITIKTTSGEAIIEEFSALSKVPGWGNARDVQTIAKKLTAVALQSMDESNPSSALRLDEGTVLACLREMFKSSQTRAQHGENSSAATLLEEIGLRMPPVPVKEPPLAPRTSTAKHAAINHDTPPPASPVNSAKETMEARDPGVSDDVWAELERSKRQVEAEERELTMLKEAKQKTEELEKAEISSAKEAASKPHDDEARRRAERLRLEAAAERVKRAKDATRLKKLEEERREEAKVQQKIRQMGQCVAGFKWLKVSGGYRDLIQESHTLRTLDQCAYVIPRNVTPDSGLDRKLVVEMSVDVMAPPVPLPPLTGVSNGAEGMTPDANGHDSVMANGTDDVGQKFIPNMIYPPPDMRTIIDSTAGFVAASANPIQFEDKIRENHRQDPKFSFLNSADPYHAYYRHRIERVRNGEVPVNEKEVTPPLKPATSAVADAIPKEPPPLQFVLEVPHKNALDLDILKLTALFTARRGPSFLRALSTREGRNYQFDFLRPDHSLYAYFNSMVEQYSQVFYPPADVLEKLESLKTLEGRAQFLSDALARGRWEAFQKEKESTREKEREAEAKAFAEIDWHDFAIVQTIEFTLADAQSELPFPMTVADVESMTLSQKRMAAMITENTAPEVEAHKASQAAAEAAAAAAAQHSLDEAVVDGGDMDVDAGDEDSAAKAEEARKQEEALARARDLQQRSTELGAPMKIRKDYVPKTLSAKQSKVNTTRCTICGQQIPIDELEEHMRIELLDPKWKSQRDALEARRAQASELQRGANAANALKQLARARGDLFDGDDEKRKREEEEELLRRKEREKGVWDGHTATKAATQDKYSTNVNFDEQIAAIHKAKGLGAVDTSTIGPAIGPSMAPATAPVPALPIPPAPAQLPTPSYPGAVISSGPQPASMPNMFGVPLGGGVGAPPGIHPSRLAAMGGLPGSGGASPGGAMTRSADEAQMETEPIAKRPRIERPEGHFYPEEDWINMHPESITPLIQLPSLPEKPEWKLDGSVISLADIPLTLLVSSLRDRIIAHVSPDGSSSIPASRIKLMFRGKVLTNANTLASYNMDDDDLLVMTVREGKKK